MIVNISDHALDYCGASQIRRTALAAYEIRELVESESFVRLGVLDRTRFDLIWDHHMMIAVVLLTVSGRFPEETVVTSIWKLHFRELRALFPSRKQIGFARAKSEEFWSRASL